MHGWRRLLPALALFGCTLTHGAVAVAAEAMPTPPIEAGYSVRWAGIEVGRFSATLRRDGAHYHVTYEATTAGPLRWFTDLRSSGWASGVVGRDGVRPEHFRGRTDWGEGERFWRVTFAPTGEVTELVLDSATSADREPVPQALMQAPDPLSLALEAMLEATPGRPFTGAMYDGKRAVGIEMDCHNEEAPIRLAALGPAARTALLCLALAERLAGRSKRWSGEVDEATEDQPPTRIWLVSGIGGLPHWPVRIEADSRWGRVVIELDQLGDPGA